MLIEEDRLRLEGGRWVADDLTAAAIPPTVQAVLAARAAARLASAGRRAIGRGDLPAAVNLLERAIALLPPEGAGEPQGPGGSGGPPWGPPVGRTPEDRGVHA